MRSRLKDMGVSLPFSGEQSNALITILFDYFIPDLEQRPLYADYITLGKYLKVEFTSLGFWLLGDYKYAFFETNYADYYFFKVMLPDALIRIFARVNKISYAFAEKELRFGVYYDDESEEKEQVDSSSELVNETRTRK